MRVIDIENITEAMRDDTRFVLRCEEVFHDKISAAAASILMNKSKKPLVCLTGPSGSGKTTTAMRLKAYLENLGVKVCLLSMDNFFLPLADRPPELTDWESPLCVNRDLLIDCIHRLSDGEEVELDIADETHSPEQLLDRSLTRDAVRRGLAALPPDHREILLLREIQGLSYEEIADVLGLEAGTVKSRIFRARKKLCSFLIKDGNIPEFVSSSKERGGDLS